MFGFELDGELIGTIRIVPLAYQLTLTETLLPQLGSDAPPVGPGDWEVGRLVLAPDCRSDVETLRHCLYLALQYACAHAPVTALFARSPFHSRVGPEKKSSSLEICIVSSCT